MKKSIVGFVIGSALVVAPAFVWAAPVPTVTVSPLVIAPGQVMTISINPNGGKVGRFYWFNKGGSEAAIASWGFGCFQFCFAPRTSKYTIPTTWSDGSNYYLKIYDASNDVFIKTNFTVQR